MIEVYCGDGRGKTTAAAGLALRAAGHGIPVIFAQFLKDGTSGEVQILRKLPQIEVLCGEQFYGFTVQMNSLQREEMKSCYGGLIERIEKKISQGKERQVIVLDEITHACNTGLVDESRICRLLDGCPGKTEIILTGRKPSENFLKRADYISEIKKVRHPYDKGVKAREGIEW